MFSRSHIVCLFIAATAITFSSNTATAQQLPGAERIIAKYQKTEVDIPMRDGVKLLSLIHI